MLGNWLLLTGMGAALGRRAGRLRTPLAVLVAAKVLLAVHRPDIPAPLAPRRAFLRGAEIGVTDTVITSFVLLAPYCLTLGYLLPLASLVAGPQKESAQIGWVYFLDNVGMVAGGVAFTFFLVYWLDPFTIVYLAAADLAKAFPTDDYRRYILQLIAVMALTGGRQG